MHYVNTNNRPLLVYLRKTKKRFKKFVKHIARFETVGVFRNRIQKTIYSYKFSSFLRTTTSNICSRLIKTPFIHHIILTECDI